MTLLQASQPVDQHARPALSACCLLDLNDLPRVGFRGAYSAEYLHRRGFVLPDAPNRAVTQGDGCQVVRLSQNEYLLLGSPTDDGKRIADEEARWVFGHEPNYLLPRQDSHCCFQLTGKHLDEVMAKLCGVDLSPHAFHPGAVAQTAAARINVIVINSGSANQASLHILCDRASKAYFHEVLLDAMQEFGARHASQSA